MNKSVLWPPYQTSGQYVFLLLACVLDQSWETLPVFSVSIRTLHYTDFSEQPICWASQYSCTVSCHLLFLSNGFFCSAKMEWSIFVNIFKMIVFCFSLHYSNSSLIYWYTIISVYKNLSVCSCTKKSYRCGYLLNYLSKLLKCQCLFTWVWEKIISFRLTSDPLPWTRYRAWTGSDSFIKHNSLQPTFTYG